MITIFRKLLEYLQQTLLSNVTFFSAGSKEAKIPFSYSGKESESNDVMMQFEEFSNVHNSDRTSNATRSNLAYKIV